MFSEYTTLSVKINYAKRITKKFIRMNTEISPFCASDWQFKLEDGKIKTISNNEVYDEISTDMYVNHYLYREPFSIENNILYGNYYYTSIGLISENDYFMALDIIEQYETRIPKKDLEKNFTYLSDKGEKIVYLGDIICKYIETTERGNEVRLNKEEVNKGGYFYSLSKKRVVKSSSVKPVLLFEGNTTEIYLNENYFKDHTNRYLFINDFDNILFNNDDLDQLLDYLSSIACYERSKINEFLSSDNLEIILDLEPPMETRNRRTTRYGDIEYIHLDDGVQVTYYRDMNGNILSESIRT